MLGLQVWASPGWVNLLWLVPIVTFWWFRSKRPQLSGQQLVLLTLFGVAFGFIEAAVVVYLRAALGLLPGFQGSLADLRHASGNYQQVNSISIIPDSLLAIEGFREAATMVVLVTLSWLSGRGVREKAAVFLWAFATWDLAYYAGLWLTVRWPGSFRESDVLFLIPQPWIAEVWFPVLVSLTTLIAIFSSRGPTKSNQLSDLQPK